MHFFLLPRLFVFLIIALVVVVVGSCVKFNESRCFPNLKALNLQVIASLRSFDFKYLLLSCIMAIKMKFDVSSK